MKQLAMLCCFILMAVKPSLAAANPRNPYLAMVDQQIAKLKSESPMMRAGAAEALGFLRAYRAEEWLIGRLCDPSPLVRRQAIMALAWCGGRPSVDRCFERWTTKTGCLDRPPTWH